MVCNICICDVKTTKYDTLDLCVECYRKVMEKLPQ